MCLRSIRRHRARTNEGAEQDAYEPLGVAASAAAAMRLAYGFTAPTGGERLVVVDRRWKRPRPDCARPVAGPTLDCNGSATAVLIA